jgi:2-polyprenyl-3-methyl-5-hydroxy-6-metoxy-1,4-benzoquinol methylase
VTEITAYRELPGVTSDTRPWPAGARLGRCGHCHMTVKVLDADWQANVKQIYDSYVVYHQSKGAEKVSFDQSAGVVESRSLALTRKLLSIVDVPNGGHSLDIGTGTGVMMRALTQSRPDLKLWAQDISGEKLEVLQDIPGFQGLYAGNLADVKGQYDLVTMVQVLEHVPDPRAFLISLKSLLKSDGVLVINIPDAEANPFDIMIVDHCSHFTLAHLKALAESAGYDVLLAENRLLPRELVLFVRPNSMPRDPVWPVASIDAAGYVPWLETVIASAQSIRAAGPMAIFGASNAGAWLCGAMPDWDGVFVDEDANRIGNKLMNRPIVAPQDVAAGTTVFVPLAHELATKIANRLSNNDAVRYVVPGVTAAD